MAVVNEVYEDLSEEKSKVLELKDRGENKNLNDCLAGLKNKIE